MYIIGAIKSNMYLPDWISDFNRLFCGMWESELEPEPEPEWNGKLFDDKAICPTST